MKILGEKLFARNADGSLVSRIGTLFFRTPGLVTKRGIHALQRMMWLEEINRERELSGLSPLSTEEEDAEMAESVDLIFTDHHVLIRPDPNRMDLAVRADEALQNLVSKRHIRFLNTSSLKVRKVLCERGENWRMARHPISQEDMASLIKKSQVAINHLPVYYYNHATGTRFITASGYEAVAALPDEEYRAQVKEVVDGLSRRNRLGHPEVDLFPIQTPIEIRQALKEVAVATLSTAELREVVGKINLEWRMSLPVDLREETTANFEWRNTMCHTITRQPNETNAEEQELVSGISAEFYRQIEWLPGARIDRGEVIFDALYDEAARTQAPDLLALCDGRVKALIFNLTRLFGALDFINIGRIAHSLARRPVVGNRRGNVYIVQYRESGELEPRLRLIRLQKWGVAERLDEGKDLLQAIIESDEYFDYILDRRLMCRQLGMSLPNHIGCGHFTEKYRGSGQYNGVTVRTAYFVRPYIEGTATDKIPPARFRNPVFARTFATLLGSAAAIDLIVGRRSSVTGELLFDQNYEIIQFGREGLPERLIVTDHAGSCVDYESALYERVAQYAQAMLRRRAFVSDYPAFVSAYVAAFQTRLITLQKAYRERRRAFDHLFVDRPFDTNGSGAYRWSRILARLDGADAADLARHLREAATC